MGKLGIRPNCTGNGVEGSVCITSSFIQEVPLRRAPRVARKCRKFFRLANVGNSIRRAILSCVIHSRSQRGFRTHGTFIRHLTNLVGSRCNRKAIAIRVHSRCCGVHRGMRPVVRVVRVTIGTVRDANIGYGIGTVHNKASKTRLSFGNLPYPGVFTNNLGFRKQRRFIPVRDVRGTVVAIMGVTRLTTRWPAGGKEPGRSSPSSSSVSGSGGESSVCSKIIGSSGLQQSFLINLPMPLTQLVGPLVQFVSGGSCYSNKIAFSGVSKVDLTPAHFSVIYLALGR